ncbi:hypothetical protein [Roseimarinus sediminis]|uniref:hypothetical protein n=1 Tax=Roseimarinus sediminis TaxID=1610899 RepID=UPI003D1DE6ED
MSSIQIEFTDKRLFKRNKRMKNICLCFVILITFSCNGGLNSQFTEIQYATYDSLTQFSIPEFISERIHNNWVELYQDYIIENNPELLDLKYEDVRYLIIPALNIPIDSLSAYDGNIFNYFRCGEFSLNNGEIWVFERDTLRAKFVIKISRKYGINQIYNSDFSSGLSTTNSSIFENVSFYFQVMLIDATEGVFFIPGVFMRKGNSDFKVLGHGMELYSLKDHYKIRWKTQKGFEQYIYKIIEADSIIRSSLEE